MSIKKVTMYTVRCDKCKCLSGNSDSEYGGWVTSDWAIDEAISELDWIKNEGKHYCTDCIEWNKDETELIPK